MKKVGIIIPNYNHANYIAEAIESAISQTYAAKEIIVVDDGSTDNSMQVIMKYKNNISYIMKENGGPSSARNEGLKSILNKVDYIQFLDADDIILPKKLETLVPIAESDPSIGIVYDDYNHLYCYEGKPVFETREYKRSVSHENMWKENLIHCNSLVKSEVFNKIGMFDENLRFAEDYDFWLRALQYYVAWHHPEVLTKVRITGNNTTWSLKPDIMNSNMKILRNKNAHIYL